MQNYLNWVFNSSNHNHSFVVIDTLQHSTAIKADGIVQSRLHNNLNTNLHLNFSLTKSFSEWVVSFINKKCFKHIVKILFILFMFVGRLLRHYSLFMKMISRFRFQDSLLQTSMYNRIILRLQHFYKLEKKQTNS